MKHLFIAIFALLVVMQSDVFCESNVPKGKIMGTLLSPDGGLFINASIGDSKLKVGDISVALGIEGEDGSVAVHSNLAYLNKNSSFSMENIDMGKYVLVIVILPLGSSSPITKLAMVGEGDSAHPVRFEIANDHGVDLGEIKLSSVLK